MSVFQNQIMAGSSGSQGDKYTLWSWGADSSGNGGRGDAIGKSSPVQIGSDDDWTPMIVMGAQSSHAIKSDGTLWSWGTGSQRGDGINTAVSSPVQIGSATNWYNLGTGYYNAWFINSSGELFGCGQGNNGKLGQGNTISHSSMVQVAGTTWAQCSGGNDFTLATKTDGTIWGWGDGGDGRTWHNNTTNYTSPVQGIAGTDWWGAKGSVDIADGWEAGVESSKFGGSSQGYWSSMVIDVNGKPWGVGWNALGNYAMSGSNNSPRQVGSDTTWTNLSHDGFGRCGINNGAMFAWGGYNITGDLGNGNTTYAAGTLYSWAGTGTATDCASGSNLYAQKLNGMIVGGTLYFSGHNANGCFGKGNTINYSSPVQGPSTTDWVKVVIGEVGVMGVRSA